MINLFANPIDMIELVFIVELKCCARPWNEKRKFNLPQHEHSGGLPWLNVYLCSCELFMHRCVWVSAFYVWLNVHTHKPLRLHNDSVNEGNDNKFQQQ